MNEHNGGGNKSMAFKLLIVFTLLLYLAPQNYFSFLAPLHLAKTSAILGIIVLFISRKGTRQDVNGCEKSVIFLSLIAVFSIPFSSWPGGSFQYFTEIFVKVIIIFFLMSRLITSVEQMESLISVLVWCTVFFALVGLWNYSHQIYLKGDRIGGPEGGMARDPNDLALCLILMVPFVVARYRLAKTTFKKSLNTLIMLVLLGGIVVTFSRGGFLGIATMMVVSFLRLPGGKKMPFLIGCCVALVIAIAVLPAQYVERLTTIVHTEKDPTGSANVRLDDMKHSLVASLKHPVLGVGIGMTTLALQEAGKKNYWGGVHSSPLQILSELGFVAFAVYVYLFYSVIRNMIKIQRLDFDSAEDTGISVYARAIELSLWGFAASGFFLPVAYRWYAFYIIGLGSACLNIAKKTQRI